jgi:hypothetical protein
MEMLEVLLFLMVLSMVQTHQEVAKVALVEQVAFCGQ